MESLSDTLWDVVICGTGLQQSLLALSLSRSGKNVLHVDPNEYYGGPEAAFSLQEAEAWVHRVSDASPSTSVYRSASITKPSGTVGLSFPRAYSIALAPQLIHARSKLLSQLVSSRAYRQVEFLAVGSFFVFKPSLTPGQKPSLARIPSTREDIGFDTSIPLKGKRSLMKFLKFVLEYESEAQTEIWAPFAYGPLTDFLHKHFKIDAELQTYIIALTLSLDGLITTKDGLHILHRHLTSMGFFGLGFAAVYPKWGGISEIAQVACRAGAVGGAVYMLGTGIEAQSRVEDKLELHLTNGEVVKTKLLVRSESGPSAEPGISRLVAILDSPLSKQFEPLVEGAPLPAVSHVAFPKGALRIDSETVSKYPVHASVHSSDTGECPVGQSIVYLTTPTTLDAPKTLESALVAFLDAVCEDSKPHCLFQMHYEQGHHIADEGADALVHNFPGASASLCFDDRVLEPIQEAWKKVMGDAAASAEYMVFTDREGAVDEDTYD